jgi:O-antigen/teichoic acid export membrane protein
MSDNTSNKIIAKNTIFLYLRMMVTMGISLYTSRVILQVLGVDDFGIYQTVGGVVGMLTFLNSALAVGTSRFLTFELGTGDFEKLKRTFSTVLSVHIILAFGIAILAETFGLWFVSYKLVIPPERSFAAVIAYHFSILTMITQLMQVPYNASIISHERMGIYAYTSIIDAFLSLIIVFILIIGSYDKLILYSILFFLIKVCMTVFYSIYCMKRFQETRFLLGIDKKILKEVLNYSGWNLLANASIALNNHGTLILLNMFFNPGVVAGRAIANQVNMAAFHFITNFRTAVNPQIVKRYAAKDYEGSKNLLLSSTKYSYYMMLMLAMPIVFVAEPILLLWLGQLPPYSVIFLQLAIITSLFQVFDTSFYTALYAKGQIRENAIISPMVGYTAFPIMYLLFKMGFSPESMACVSLIGVALLGLIIKPLLIIKIVDYTWNDIFEVFKPCLKVTLVSLFLPLSVFYYLSRENINNFISFVIIVLSCEISVVCSCWFFGLSHDMRAKLIQFVKNKYS